MPVFQDQSRATTKCAGDSSCDLFLLTSTSVIGNHEGPGAFCPPGKDD